MKILYVKLILCLFVFIILVNFPLFSQKEKREKELIEIIKDADVPGIQLIYSKKHKVQVYNEGIVKNGSDKSVTSNTIFEAASLSKSVFAYAVLRLCDRGIIDLDAPLLSIIGNYNRFDNSNPKYASITARMVLRHTTGLPNWGSDSTVTLMFTPDSCFSYSGEGYLFLQKVLEKKLNKPLNQIMQEEVFTPLKMENSSYVWTDKFDTVSSFGNSREEITRHNNANAAYSLLTNATDYSLFLQALIKGKGLKAKTHKLMFEKSTSGNRFNNPPNIADPFISWGLGVGLQQNENGKAIWHWGDNGDFKCFYMAFPDKDEWLIYFTHSWYGLFITDDILKQFFGSQTFWATKWFGYGYKSPELIKTLRAELVKSGYENAIDIVSGLKKKDENYNLPEKDLNEFGFILMRQGKKSEAIEIFKLNLNLYPESANGYESLAEGYEAVGDNELAIKNFRRSLELNPGNEYAAGRIKKLESISK